MTTAHLLASAWRLDPVAVGVAAAMTALYLRSERRIGRRVAWFAFALGWLGFALCSPIAWLANGYVFSAHMLQHLVLVLVVPPLALLGLTPQDSPAVGVARPVQRAVVPWLLGGGAMWLWHEPSLCNAAACDPVVHGLQAVSLVGMGTAFWWPVLAPRRRARLHPLAAILYLFSACIACTLLGVIITFSPVELCSVFLHPVGGDGVMALVRDGWGLDAATDQKIGGLIMWLPACLVYAAGIGGALVRLYREDDLVIPTGDPS